MQLLKFAISRVLTCKLIPTSIAEGCLFFFFFGGGVSLKFDGFKGERILKRDIPVTF